MPVIYGLYIIVLAFAIAISVYLVYRLWGVRTTAGAYNLIWAIFCVLIWSFAYIFEIISRNSAAKLVWLKLEYLGIPFISLAIFTFTLAYSGRIKWLTRPRLLLLSVIPAISLALAVTNEWHHLIWATLTMPPAQVGPVSVTHGLWYNVNVIYSYILILLATYFLIQIASHLRSVYRSQALVMLVGIVIPWISNIYYVLHPGLDWTPLAFTLTIVAFEVGFARLGLMDILPVDQGQIFSIMQDGIIVIDAKGRVVEANPSALSTLDKTPNDLIGKDVLRALPAWADWNVQTGTAIELNKEISFGSGPSRRFFNLRVSPILDRQGQVSGQMISLTDFTEEKLAQSQMRLQSTALEAAENGIVITDANGNIEWSNAAFSRLTGYGTEEILGKNTRMLKSGQQEPDFYKNLWETVLAGKVWHGDLINRRKDGSLYYEEMTITSLFEEGRVTHFIAIKQDVSERKQAEEALKLAHEQAVEANRLKTQLLASVSHDLRTPLGTIMGYAEMLQTGVLGLVNGEQQNASAEILDSSNRLLAFVNNLIGQAQIETGRIVIRPRDFSPTELTDGVKSMVGFMARKKGLDFISEIDQSLPSSICADPYWLKQILYNLVNNALKFTNQGYVRVRLLRAGEAHWAMQVCDSGSGIPEEARRSIFEPFRQIERKGMVEGSGLGLSIVNQLTTLMEGKIELQSEIGKGSTFTITLPLKDGAK